MVYTEVRIVLKRVEVGDVPLRLKFLKENVWTDGQKAIWIYLLEADGHVVPLEGNVPFSWCASVYFVT